ncbi:MAG: cupin domain-containing protein [Bacteroidota bacterium]
MASKEIISFGGMSVHFCLDEKDTQGQITMFEVTVDPATRMPAPHYHKDFDETVYGLEGTTTYTVDAKTILLSPGDSIFIPRGTVHGFENKTDARVKFLCVINPGIFGPAYFHEIASIINAGGPPDMGKLLQTLTKFGLVPVMG